MTNLQKKVLEAARKKLNKKSWYRGVCIDNFPSDHYIITNGFNAAVSRVIMETNFWDNCLRK